MSHDLKDVIASRDLKDVREVIALGIALGKAGVAAAADGKFDALDIRFFLAAIAKAPSAFIGLDNAFKIFTSLTPAEKQELVDYIHGEIGDLADTRFSGSPAHAMALSEPGMAATSFADRLIEAIIAWVNAHIRICDFFTPGAPMVGIEAPKEA